MGKIGSYWAPILALTGLLFANPMVSTVRSSHRFEVKRLGTPQPGIVEEPERIDYLNLEFRSRLKTSSRYFKQVETGCGNSPIMPEIVCEVSNHEAVVPVMYSTELRVLVGTDCVEVSDWDESVINEVEHFTIWIACIQEPALLKGEPWVGL